MTMRHISLRGGALLSLVALVPAGTKAQPLPPCSGSYCTVTGDGVVESELDNPRLRSSVSLSAEHLDEEAYCAARADEYGRDMYQSLYFEIEVDVASPASWQTPHFAISNRTLTMCVEEPGKDFYGPGESVVLESRGAAVGHEESVVSWTKRFATSLGRCPEEAESQAECEPAIDERAVIDSRRVRLASDTLLHPVAVVVAYPEGGIPALSREDALQLFDDWPQPDIYRETTNGVPTYFDSRLLAQEPVSLAFSEVGAPLHPNDFGQVKNFTRPDDVFVQCGVQTRLVGYAAVPVHPELYYAEANIASWNRTSPVCLEAPSGPDTALIADTYARSTQCPQYPAIPEDSCMPPSPGGGGRAPSGSHTRRSNWIAKAAHFLYQDPRSGHSLPTNDENGRPLFGDDPILQPTVVVFTGFTQPLRCSRGSAPNVGFDDGAGMVTIGLETAGDTPTVLAHELYHSVSRTDYHDASSDARLMRPAQDGTHILGCSRWRSEGQPMPHNCAEEEDATTTGNWCTLLRNHIGGGGNSEVETVEPSPDGRRGFSYGSSIDAPAAEYTARRATIGSHSLVVPAGWTEIVSPPVQTTGWGSVGTELTLDVYVPAEVPNPWWLGSVALAFHVPAAGVSDHWLGQVDLTPLPRGRWSTIRVPVTEAVRDAILGDFPDARVKILTNTPSGWGEDPVLVDYLRFEGELTPRTVFHQQGSEGIEVASSDFLSFEHLSDWNAGALSVGQELERISDGERALAVPAHGWLVVESRAFSTSELPPVTETLSLDLFVPDPQPNPWWVGELHVSLSCPSAGLHDAWIGRAALDHLFTDEYNHLTFSLAPEVLAALRGDHADCRWSLALNSNPGSGAFVFDRLGFLP